LISCGRAHLLRRRRPVPLLWRRRLPRPRLHRRCSRRSDWRRGLSPFGRLSWTRFSAHSGYQFCRRRRRRFRRRRYPRRPRRRPRRRPPPSRSSCGRAPTATSLPSHRRRPRRRCCRSLARTLLVGIAGAAVLARAVLAARPAPCARVGALRLPCRAPAMRRRVRPSVGSAPRALVWVRRRPAAVRASVPRSLFRLPHPTCGGLTSRSSSSRYAAGSSLWRTRAIGFGMPLARWSSPSTSFRGRLLSPMHLCRRRICLGSCTFRCRSRACRRRTSCGLC
jgi:hypothetical protein